MKLIDLLVQELPKHGGWPVDHYALVQGSNGNIYLAGGGMPIFHFTLAEDWQLAEVARGHYEAALAASQKPAWNGEGLPPVGCECEYAFIANYKERYSCGKVIAYGESNVFIWHKSSGYEFIHQLNKIKFRPIRPEADKKRDEAKSGIREITDADGFKLAACMIDPIYDAIAAGKIPHVKLGD